MVWNACRRGNFSGGGTDTKGRWRLLRGCTCGGLVEGGSGDLEPPPLGNNFTTWRPPWLPRHTQYSDHLPWCQSYLTANEHKGGGLIQYIPWPTQAYNASDRERRLDILEKYRVGPQALRLTRRYWDRLTMVVYEGKCWKKCLIYEVKCSMCEYIYIGNTQHKFNKIMDVHFSDLWNTLKKWQN